MAGKIGAKYGNQNAKGGGKSTTFGEGLRAGILAHKSGGKAKATVTSVRGALGAGVGFGASKLGYVKKVK